MSLFGSISKALFGDGGAGEIAAADRRAAAQMKEGYNKALPELEGARDVYDPYTQSGEQFQSLYDDFMGLNGPEAQAAAAELMRSNPAFQSQMVESLRASDRGLNAMGAGPGKQALADSRIYAQNAMSFADKYRAGGTQGLAAAGSKSNAMTNLGNLHYGYGASRAGQSINYGNAMAQAQQAPINNLLGLGSVIAQGFGGGK